MPKGYEFDLFVFNLCDGDISKVPVVEQMTYEEAVAFMSLKKYQSYVEKKYIDKMSKKRG